MMMSKKITNSRRIAMLLMYLISHTRGKIQEEREFQIENKSFFLLFQRNSDLRSNHMYESIYFLD